MAHTTRHEKTEQKRKRTLLRTATRTERQTWRQFAAAVKRTWENHTAMMDARNMSNI